jgi:hypothetical protein
LQRRRSESAALHAPPPAARPPVRIATPGAKPEAVDLETNDPETSDRETSDRETSDRETSDREVVGRPSK